MNEPSWVSKSPQLPTLAQAPIDPQRAIRAGLDANNELIVSFMRSIAPQPPIDGNVVGTYSTPAESASRTERYKFSIVAIVLICGGIAGGIVLMAWRNGYVDSILGLAGWLALTGTLAAGAVTWLQTMDFQHSAEGIALAREGYRSVVDQTDADTRATLASAYVYAIKTEADAKSAQQAAQNRALDAEVQRLMLAAPGPLPKRQAQSWAEDTPVAIPAETPVATPVQPPVDPVARAVLAWVAALYDEEGALHPQTRRVLREMPWSARSAVLSPVDKARVKTAILSMEPPLFVSLPGNGLALPCPFKALALKRIRAAL